MISVQEGQIREILRPEISDEFQFIAWLPLLTSQIHLVSDLLSHSPELKHHNFKPSQTSEDLMDFLLILTKFFILFEN